MKLLWKLPSPGGLKVPEIEKPHVQQGGRDFDSPQGGVYCYSRAFQRLEIYFGSTMHQHGILASSGRRRSRKEKRKRKMRAMFLMGALCLLCVSVVLEAC
jgi:hypothetical protein